MKESVLTLSNVPLSNFCTYHTGGKVRSMKIVYDIDGFMQSAVGDYEVIGCGSKLLVSDDGYDGTVILMRIFGMKRTEFGVYAYAGVPLPALSRYCESGCLGGLAWACGIPGSLGGAIKLNAGAFGFSIGDLVNRVDVFDGKEIVSLGKDELSFSYRSSNISGIVVGAELALSEQKREELLELRRNYFAKRRALQPRGFSCGSVFKNGDVPSGHYIEQAGLKGMTHGGAQISEKHANFIINNGNATSKDVYTLIRTAKAEVKSKFGVKLSEEVIIWGNSDVFAK